MLLKNCIYLIEILLSIGSIPVLMYSMYSNPYKDICKKSILLATIYIVYIVFLFSLLGFCNIPYGLESLMISLAMLVAVILYIVSIVINIKKRKKLTQISSNKKRVTAIFVMLLVLPILFVSFKFIQVKLTIDKSNLILVYYSSGNGGIGESDYFAYAIGDDFCHQIDFGIDIGGLYLYEYLPKDTIEIKDISVIPNYEIDTNGNEITVYKNGKQICKKRNDYFNIKFERGFYINKD